MRFGNEARVGFVVVLALALALTGYFFLRGIGLGADTYTIRLNGAAPISVGNDVLLQGVKVGTVKNVTLDPETQRPLITIAIQKATPPFKLLTSYRYAVQASGIIGENYVDIRGPFDPSTQVYAANTPGQIIPGVATGGIASLTDAASQLSGSLEKTLSKVNVTLDRVNRGVLSYSNQVKLARALDSTSRLAQQASSAFGPNGVRLGFGDPQAQRFLNQTLRGTAAASGDAVAAAREAAIAARNIRILTGQAGGNINRLSNQASGILGQAGGIVSENRGELRQLLVSFRQTSRNVAGLTETLAYVLREGGFKENSQIAFGSLRRSAENVEATTAGFRKLAEDPEFSTTLRTTLAALRTSTESLAVTARSIQNLVGDETTQAQLKSTLTTLSQTAVTLQATTQNLQVTTQGFANIVGDPKVQADLKAIPNELLGTLEATRATAERVNGLLGGRRRRNDAGTPGTPEGASSGATPARALGTDGVSFTLRQLGKRDENGARTFGDIDFRGELFGSPLRAGISDIGEDTGVTLQTGRFIGKNAALRYGVFRSKLGVGADYTRGRFRLEGNLYDPNHRSYSLYGGYRLSPQVEVLVGGEERRGVRSGAVGVRLSP